jgi:phage shock protein A
VPAAEGVRWPCHSLTKRGAGFAGTVTPLTGPEPRLTRDPYSGPANFATLCALNNWVEPGGRMFSRLGNLIRGFFSLFISGIERRNPEALLELEQENLRKQIAQFNQGLATHAGLCERIMGQVRKLEAEQKDLRAKTAAHLRAGNKSAAGQYALRLQTIEAQLEENRKQLEQAEGTYKNLIKARDVAVQTARAKIESLKGAINDMKMNQAMAEIHEMASGMITSIGGSGDTLNRLHEMVEEERTKAAGRARIAKDSIDMSGVELKETEMNALADQALADFAAREGISIEGNATPAPAPRTMGAQSESQSG